MNKLKTINGTFLCLAITLLMVTGCSKNNPKPEEPYKEFTELNENEQKQILVTEFNKRGGDYSLVGVTTYKENGEVESGYNPEDCERKIVITIPSEIDKDLFVEQNASEGSCGTDYNDVVHNVVRLTFANYKAGIGFYTVQKDQIGYKNIMYFDPEQNKDSKYLILNSFQASDLQRMQDGDPNVVARRYKAYTFERK